MSHKNRPHRPVYDEPAKQDQGAHLSSNTKECCGDAAEHLREIKKILGALADNQKGEDSKATVKDRKKWKLDVATFWVVATYTGLTFGLFGLGFCQLRDANIQTIAQTRAWLEPENFSFNEFKYGSPIYITGETENVGHEPALKPTFATQRDDFGIVSIPEGGCCDNNLVVIPRSDPCSDTRMRRSGVVFPGQKLTYRVLIKPDSPKYPSPDDFDSVKAGKSVFYWRDCVAYETLGERHASSFCHYLVRSPVDGILIREQCHLDNDAH